MYFSFLMTELSLEIVSWVVVPMLPTKARTVHLTCDKAHVESIGPGKRGQPQGSSWTPVAIPCGIPVSHDCASFYPFNHLPANCQSNTWTHPRSQYWVYDGQFYAFLSSSISLETFSFFIYETFSLNWVHCFQKSEDFKLYIYDSHLFCWHVKITRCSDHPRVVAYLAGGPCVNCFAFLCLSLLFSETQLVTQDSPCRVVVTSLVDVHEVLGPEPGI